MSVALHRKLIRSNFFRINNFIEMGNAEAADRGNVVSAANH